MNALDVQDVELMGQEWALKQCWEGAVQDAGQGTFAEADLDSFKALGANMAAGLCQEACAAAWPLHLDLKV